MEKFEFFKAALEYAERRITATDQKASILMAIQLGVYAVFFTIVKDSLGGLEGILKQGGIASYATILFLLVSLSILVYVAYHLIKTIRPDKRQMFLLIFSKDKKLQKTKKYNEDTYLMWFTNKNKTISQYKNIANSLKIEDLLTNLQEAHFTSLNLLEQKYKFYRPAVSGLYLSVLWNAFGVVLLSLQKLIGG